ncbi:unnamed protein product [Prunus brigantina]
MPQCTRRKLPLTSSVCSQKLKYLLLPSLPPFYRTSLASGTEMSQLFAALLTHVTHAQGSPSSLTSPLAPVLRRFDFSILLLFEKKHNFLGEWQARMGRVFTHLSCRTAGMRGSSFHSPLVRNGRHAGVDFSLTSRAERQARGGRVFTHLSCRTAGTRGSSSHSPLVPNGRPPLTHPFCTGQPPSVCRSLPIFKPTPWLEDLGDYMIITGLQTTDARSRVRMPELKNKQVPNQEVPPRSETWGTTVCTISDHPLTS